MNSTAPKKTQNKIALMTLLKEEGLKVALIIQIKRGLLLHQLAVEELIIARKIRSLIKVLSLQFNNILLVQPKSFQIQ
jgi:hypothetical protein